MLGSLMANQLISLAGMKHVPALAVDYPLRMQEGLYTSPRQKACFTCLLLPCMFLVPRAARQ